MRCARLIGCVLTLVSLGCLEENQDPVGLRPAVDRGGPRIHFDLEERPFPEIPYPNDIATRRDTTSPTGRRVNISELGGSRAEERVRRYLNEQTGFGVFSSLSVSFDKPLDLHDLVRRHQEPVPDLSDDAVYVVNVDPKSPEYGAFVELDMGRGNFPIMLEDKNRYFALDPRGQGNNLLFESVEEIDANQNGALDPMEDTDDDGVWDHPNTLDKGANPDAFGQLLDFYERESNTLLLRPIRPLAPGTTYAVVLTGALRGESGLPIDSPFPFINHTRQTRALTPLRGILPNAFPERFDRSLEGVRFAWTFTTSRPTDELLSVRAGLYGHGPLSWLADAYEPKLKMIHTAKAPGAQDPLTFEVASFITLATPLITQALGGAGGGEVIAESVQDIDYVVSGTFMSPYFLTDRDGRADAIPKDIEPGDARAIDLLNFQDDDEAFPRKLDLATAQDVGVDEVPFVCVVPKPTPTQQAPFPTVIYSHAIGSTRFEMLAFAGVLAKFGLATCTIDAVGHGIDIPQEYDGLLRRVAGNLKLPGLRSILQHHRARDLNNDGAVDTGADYFTADLLHSRDVIRQTTIDQMQFIRILRTFDGERRFPQGVDESDPYILARRPIVGGFDADGDGTPEIAGDFNGDGVMDFGGDGTYVAWGTSLGGIQTTVLAGAEPLIRATLSNAGGGGLGDIATRTSISNVRAGVVLRVMGPVLIGRPVEDGAKTRLSWILPNNTSDTTVPFATIDALEDGDRVVLRNLIREKNPYVPEDERMALVRVREGTFRVGIAADAINSTARRAALGFSPSVDFYKEHAGCVDTSPSKCLPEVDVSALSSDAARHVATDPTQFGDPLVIEIYDADGALKQTIDTFLDGAVYHNVFYPPGAPLAALVEGWGLQRQTPTFRRFLGIGQTLLEPSDPAVWASHYIDRVLEFPYESEAYRVGATNAVFVGTLGDQTVPINAALTLARVTGVLDTQALDPRFGMTANQFLVQNQVYEGIEGLNRIPGSPRMLFDPDDLSDGTWRSDRDGRPSPTPEAPLRATIDSPYYGGVLGLRLPYLDERGEHTFNVPDPDAAFDMHMFMLQQTAWYLATGGRELRDDRCFAQDILLRTCDFYSPEAFTPTFPEGPVTRSR